MAPPAPQIRYLRHGGATIVHARLPAWEADTHVSVSAENSIGLSFTAQACVIERSGRSIERVVPARGAVVVGPEPVSWIRTDGDSELVEVVASFALRADVAAELGAGADLETLDWDAEDPILWGLAARLRAAVDGSWQAEALEIEALVRRLYAHVLVSRFGGRWRERGQGALDARRLARVVGAIEAGMATELSLTTLADAAALSPFHFQRSFTRATGLSPHRFVALRRLERAEARLRAGASHDAAAAACGYADRRALRAALARWRRP